MLFPRRWISTAAALLLALTSGQRVSASDKIETSRLAPGSTLEILTAGNIVYHQVRVRTVSAQTAVIQHEGGIASLRLRDLSPELQQRFGYNPDAALAEAEKQKATAATAEQRRKEQLAAQQRAQVERLAANPPRNREESKIDTLLASLGEAPEVRPKVDLRTRYNELGLWVKNQGGHPSCSVFAIVSALEFQSAELTGTAERFSDAYLIWATRKTLNRHGPAIDPPSSDEKTPFTDQGFSLPEVVTALRSYGITSQSSMPSGFTGMNDEALPPELIAQARNSHRAGIHILPGRDGAALTASIVHALNAGIPVPVGIKWPVEYNWRTGYLDKQVVHAAGGHAVTIVGYTSPTGRLENTLFTFKNSWGPGWGIDGYGTATYEFLSNNLDVAIVLEVQPR